MSLIETVPVHVLLPSLHVSSRASFPFLLAVAERLASDAKDEALALVRLVILADASREGGIRGGVLSPGTVGFWPGACEKPTSPTGDVDHASPLPRAPAWLLPQQSSARDTRSLRPRNHCLPLRRSGSRWRGPVLRRACPTCRRRNPCSLPGLHRC